MKKIVLLTMLVTLIIGLKAYSYEPTGPLRVTGDRNLDSAFENLGFFVSYDEEWFISELSATYRIAREEVEKLVKSMYPINAYLAIVLSRLSGKPIDVIAKEYQPREGKGWAGIIKSLEIKPGSKKFLKLKNDTEAWLKKAKLIKQASEAKIKENLKNLGLAPQETKNDK